MLSINEYFMRVLLQVLPLNDGVVFDSASAWIQKSKVPLESFKAPAIGGSKILPKKRGELTPLGQTSHTGVNCDEAR